MSGNPFEEINCKLESLEKLILEIKQSQINKLAEEALLSPGETCKIFQPQISRATLHNWTQEGYLQKHQVGGRVFYRKSEILASLTTLKRYSHR